MDLTCFNWVQMIKKSDLPSNSKYLAFYLATFMNAEHNIAWPSQSRIANETGLTEPTIRKHLKILEENDWLIIKTKFRPISAGNQNYHHNEYMIGIPKQRVNDLLSELSRGLINHEQRVNESSAEGKLFTPNNNINNNNNNNNNIGDKSPIKKSILDDYDFSEWPEIPEESLFEDWIKSKKKAKGSVSQRAINTVGKELTKAKANGYSVSDCLSAAENSCWKGFKSEWMNNGTKQKPQLASDLPFPS